MDVRPGYKQTEAGVIPEEWEVATFSDIAHIERGKFTARPRNDPKYYGGNIPFIQTGDVSNSNGLITAYSQTLNAEGLKVSKLFPRGTLFFTIAANIGDVGFAAFDTACPDSLVAITPSDSCDAMWLSYELASRKRKFESIATHNAQLNINLEKLRPYLLPCPPLAEQRTIAAALKSADGMLEELDRLIAKRRDLKQAAMQQLLTGKTRLPGFCGNWTIKRLGEVVSRVSTGLNPRRNFRLNDGGSFYYVTIKNFAVGKLFLDERCDRINEAAFHRINERSDLRKDDIIFSSIGRVGDAYLIPETPRNWNINESVFTLRPDKTQIVPTMLFHLLSGSDLVDQLAQGVTGSTFKSIKQTQLKAISCSIPADRLEQVAISTVLSDIDAELSALQARRDKTFQLRQGMMQELLTGRTRLV